MIRPTIYILRVCSIIYYAYTLIRFYVECVCVFSREKRDRRFETRRFLLKLLLLFLRRRCTARNGVNIDGSLSSGASRSRMKIIQLRIPRCRAFNVWNGYLAVSNCYLIYIYSGRPTGRHGSVRLTSKYSRIEFHNLLVPSAYRMSDGREKNKNNNDNDNAGIKIITAGGTRVMHTRTQQGQIRSLHPNDIMSKLYTKFL